MKGRFENKFKIDKDSGCWEWTASKHGHGYGMFHTTYRGSGAKMKFAHRVSYELYKEPIPDGLCVLHTCDNYGCVNPEHLFLGTHKENMEDMAKKGRAPNKSRLSVESTLEIINSSKLNKELAEEYRIDCSQISRIRNNKVKQWRFLHD